MSTCETKVVFEDVKKAQGTSVILDMRNRDEVENAGHIGGANIVPFSEMEGALGMDDEAFKAKYGFKKPSKDDTIITHCMIGGRAQKGGDCLVSHGYKNVSVYAGSMKDWVQKGGEVKPGKPTTG